MRLEGVNDYSSYEEIEKMIGYCGFITNEATFLRAYKKGEYYTSHSQYAQDYLEAIQKGQVLDAPKILKELNLSKIEDAFDLLIEKLGYISYSLEEDTSYIVLPATIQITEQQLELLKQLNEFNHVQTCTNIRETESVTNRKKC